MQTQPALDASIRVLLVQSRPLTSGDARMGLLRDERFHLLGQVATAGEATRLSRAEPPDVVVCDAALPEPGAVELARFYRVRMPRIAVVFVTRMHSDEQLFEAVRGGAAAYLLADTDRRGFCEAVARVAKGCFPIDEEVLRHPAVASRVLVQFRQSAWGDPTALNLPGQPVASASVQPHRELAPLFVPLSAREIEILDLVARGNSNKLVARRLGISDQTVKNHVTTILRKLEVNDRTEAVVYALRNGWIRIDAPLAANR